MKYIIQGAEEDVATQDSQVDAMLTRGIQALVLIPVNIESAINLADRVKREADIPIVSYNSVIPTASIDSGQLEITILWEKFKQDRH